MNAKGTAPIRSRGATVTVLIGCFTLLAVGAIFFIGFGAGFGAGRVTADPANCGSTAQSGGALALDCKRQPRDGSADRLFPEFAIFWEAMDLLYDEYYGDLPNSDDATYAAIRAVIEQLDDPNTSILTPDEAEYYRDNIEGEFEGIGARVSWDPDANTLVIVEPFENQPAWEAGLRRDDLIYAVDGVSVVGMGMTEAVQSIRGQVGSSVTLTIMRPGEAEPYDVTIVRDNVDVPTISTKSLGAESAIAYIRLNSFNENAGELVLQAVQDAVDQDAAALILDLRGNSGGLLREAVSISSLFLDDKIVVYEQFRDGGQEIYHTDGQPLTTDMPLVVLVNEGSASASEIVAGALQDHGRATLIGTTTFGKGSVQLPYTLANDGILRITIAQWLTPNQLSISGVGLTPDIVVENGDAEDGVDQQLKSAVDFLESALSTSPASE